MSYTCADEKVGVTAPSGNASLARTELVYKYRRLLCGRTAAGRQASNPSKSFTERASHPLLHSCSRHPRLCNAALISAEGLRFARPLKPTMGVVARVAKRLGRMKRGADER